MVGRGFGKVILFGDHVVVHEQQSLVAALPLETTAKIVPFCGSYIIDNRPKHPLFVANKTEAYERMASVLARVFGMEKRYSFELGGTLPVTSGGIGASAAAAVSITRALSVATAENCDERRVIEIALEGERVIHGNPSGIDVVASAVPGVLVFQKQGFVLVNRKLSQQYLNMPLVLVDSQMVTKIKESIADVAAFKEAHAIEWQRLMLEYELIFEAALKAVLIDDLLALGNLFNQVNSLLARLGLSCCHAERVRSLALQEGALGTKMTGSCRGGLVAVLGRNHHHARQLSKFFREQGYFVIPTFQESKIESNAVNP